MRHRVRGAEQLPEEHLQVRRGGQPAHAGHEHRAGRALGHRARLTAAGNPIPDPYPLTLSPSPTPSPEPLQMPVQHVVPPSAIMNMSMMDDTIQAESEVTLT